MDEFDEHRPIHNKHFHFYLDCESDPYRSPGEFNDHRHEFNRRADEFDQRLDSGLDRDDVLAQAEGEFNQRPAVFELCGAIAAFNLQPTLEE
ncbi:hypothetical protein H6F75_08950 [Nodosilinea sp. FACHB-131]|uniref:hypothetical protein n=1 Tax=Cyanophyceae TaxID=3028117 RepID=UPI001685F8F5|nr:hypothetical protein [Nodosilinea sp. FACHB-131]MBD1873609.1 hypothetical protein [Nodosilinea sp. FACHB-131]